MYNVSVFLATMLKRDTQAVLACMKVRGCSGGGGGAGDDDDDDDDDGDACTQAAPGGRDGRSALSLIVEQVMRDV